MQVVVVLVDYLSFAYGDSGAAAYTLSNTCYHNDPIVNFTMNRIYPTGGTVILRIPMQGFMLR